MHAEMVEEKSQHTNLGWFVDVFPRRRHGSECKRTIKLVVIEGPQPLGVFLSPCLIVAILFPFLTFELATSQFGDKRDVKWYGIMVKESKISSFVTTKLDY